MHFKCCVPGCPSDSRYNTNVNFFKFPHYISEKERFGIWVKTMGCTEITCMPAKQVYDSLAVCGSHFSDNQIFQDNQNRIGPASYLFPDAVPNQFLPAHSSAQFETIDLLEYNDNTEEANYDEAEYENEGDEEDEEEEANEKIDEGDGVIRPKIGPVANIAPANAQNVVNKQKVKVPETYLEEQEILDMFPEEEKAENNANEVLLLSASDNIKEPPKYEAFPTTCRICLARLDGIAYKSVYSTHYKITLRSLIKEYTQVEIPDIADELPQSICMTCVHFLADMHMFKSRCCRNDVILKKLVELQKEAAVNWQVDVGTIHSYARSVPETSPKQPSATIATKPAAETPTTNFSRLAFELGEQRLNIFRCKDCLQVYSTRTEWLKHRGEAKHFKQRTRPCPICNKKFKRNRLKTHLLERHMRKRTENSACPVCGRHITRPNLKRHMRRHTGEKPFLCDECPKSFIQKVSLVAHRWMHERRRDPNYKPPKSRAYTQPSGEQFSSVCGICKRGYLCADLQAHLKDAHGAGEQGNISEFDRTLEIDKWTKLNKAQRALGFKTHPFGYGVQAARFKLLEEEAAGEPKQFQCGRDGCTMTFAVLDSLRRHRNEHRKNYSCAICNFVFKNTMGLIDHMWIHNNEKRFKCTLCDKAFLRPLGLYNHMLVHQNIIRKFQCKECGMRFRLSKHLSNHMLTHSDERPYQCNMCEKSYKLPYMLTVHKRTHTGDCPFACRICDRRFPSGGIRNGHEVKSHGRNAHEEAVQSERKQKTAHAPSYQTPLAQDLEAALQQVDGSDMANVAVDKMNNAVDFIIQNVCSLAES